MLKKVLPLILSAAMCFSLAACTTPGNGPDNVGSMTEINDQRIDEGKKVLKYALREDVPTMDPQLMVTIPSSTVAFHVFEGLMRNHVGTIEEGIAESYEVSEDGKIYTFHLRDAKWSDGVPVRAQDFEYAFKRLADPATASPYSFLISNLVKNAGDVIAGKMSVEALGVKAVDDKTFIVELNNPSDYFLGMLSMAQLCPVRKDLAEKYGKEFAAGADKNVYNGPFIIKSWAQGDRMILEKNPNFWNAGAIRLDEVHILSVPDPMTALAMYEKGELDFTDVPPEVAMNYEDEIMYYSDGADDFIKLNMDGRCELTSKNLRLAMNYALNRKDFVNLTTNSIYEPNTRYVLPDVNGVEEKYGDEYPYEAYPSEGDAVKAKEHLDKALKELGLSDPSQIELELLTTDQDMGRKQAEVIQNQLQETLGIKISIRQVTYKQKVELDNNSEFEMTISGWAPDYADPITYLEIWASDSSYNQGSYSNPDYDKYLKGAMVEVDARKRMDLLFNAEKLLLDDAAIMPLHLRRNPMLLNSRVKGFETYFVGVNYDYVYADIER